MICGVGPLHAAKQWGALCACSFLRADKRVCRTCAIGIDLVADGRSRITDAPDADSFAYIRDLIDRGQRFLDAIDTSITITITESAYVGEHRMVPYTSVSPRRT